MVCGIYKITNKITGLCYIGQSIDIFSRWRAHSSANDNLKLHQSIKDYGIQNFVFEILELCEKSELDEKEKSWIKKLNSFENGYNMTTGGLTSLPISPQCKEVNQYTLEGILINTFPSLKIAMQETGISQIAACCRGERRTAGGYQWRYKKDVIDQTSIPECEAPKSAKRAVIQYDENGKEIARYESIAQAARNNNISPSGILLACKNKKRKSCNSYWSYEE